MSNKQTIKLTLVNDIMIMIYIVPIVASRTTESYQFTSSSSIMKSPLIFYILLTVVCLTESALGQCPQGCNCSTPILNCGLHSLVDSSDTEQVLISSDVIANLASIPANSIQVSQ